MSSKKVQPKKRDKNNSVINPESNKLIKIGGPTYLRLVRTGKIALDGTNLDQVNNKIERMNKGESRFSQWPSDLIGMLLLYFDPCELDLVADFDEHIDTKLHSSHYLRQYLDTRIWSQHLNLDKTKQMFSNNESLDFDSLIDFILSKVPSCVRTYIRDMLRWYPRKHLKRAIEYLWSIASCSYSNKNKDKNKFNEKPWAQFLRKRQLVSYFFPNNLNHNKEDEEHLIEMMTGLYFEKRNDQKVPNEEHIGDHLDNIDDLFYPIDELGILISASTGQQKLYELLSDEHHLRPFGTGSYKRIPYLMRYNHHIYGGNVKNMREKGMLHLIECLIYGGLTQNLDRLLSEDGRSFHTYAPYLETISAESGNLPQILWSCSVNSNSMGLNTILALAMGGHLDLLLEMSDLVNISEETKFGTKRIQGTTISSILHSALMGGHLHIIEKMMILNPRETSTSLQNNLFQRLAICSNSMKVLDYVWDKDKIVTKEDLEDCMKYCSISSFLWIFNRYLDTHKTINPRKLEKLLNICKINFRSDIASCLFEMFGHTTPKIISKLIGICIKNQDQENIEKYYPLYRKCLPKNKQDKLKHLALSLEFPEILQILAR